MARTAGHTTLTQDDCSALLQTSGIGRVSYTEMALPIIRAVPFVVDAGGVIAVVGLSPVRPDLFEVPTVVAFEVGEWDQRRLGLVSWIDGEPAVP